MTFSGSETIIYEKRDDRVDVILNRPGKLNAVNNDLWRGLQAALRMAERDSDVRVVVIKGAGGNFCSGEDLSGEGTSEVMSPDPRTKPYLSDLLAAEDRRMDFWRHLFYFPKDTIAQVDGYCLAFGCCLQMTCGTSVVADNAILGDPSIRMGLAPASALWTWRVGLKKASELLLSGRYISGKEAEQIGLVTASVPGDRLAETVDEWVEGLLRAGGLSSIDARMGTLGGIDGAAVRMGQSRMEFEGIGFGAAARFTAYVRFLSCIQRRGFAPGEYNFWLAREQRGMKQALKERDTEFSKFFPYGLDGRKAV
ncbi:MAG: enoyl-CoA hydratase/isomerase family protein [Chloroflexi bacterium]|nr:enoyl-CoA hydratase/isomerase family protein [Chloroflexota bacterium]